MAPKAAKVNAKESQVTFSQNDCSISDEPMPIGIPGWLDVKLR